MEFGVLGPVEVRLNGLRLPSGSARERFVLATLLLNGDRPTPADELIAPLWAEPPASARAQLHNLVSSLRRRLRDGDPDLIETRPGGYLLHLGDHRLDLAEFRRLVAAAAGSAAAGDHRTAADRYAAALALWRGPALADVPDDLAAPDRAALHEERLAAAEAGLDPALALGRHDEVLRAVTALLADHPYREGLYQRQMLALVAAGRRADALAAYRTAYRRLVDGHGVEPGPALRDLAGHVLRGGAPTLPTHPVPHQLPATITPLTGRDPLATAIAAALTPDTAPRPTAGTGSPSDAHPGGRWPGVPAPPVVALVGPGGIGKTALALTAAHLVVNAYPDGQLHADLRGTHDAPATPHAVVGRFLRALGVPGPEVPDDPEERLASYRTALAGRRVLVVLDDAADEAQVRALLPGSPGCGVLVTSRRALLGLVGVARHAVPVLAPDDAVRLLALLAGESRVAAEPAAAAAIAARCGQLPLALCIAGARLAARPDLSLADFRDRLAEQRRLLDTAAPHDPGGRLDELTAGDLDVRASIELSYRALTPAQSTLFRRLSLLTAPTWPAWVTTTLTDPPTPTDRVLAELVEMHLVEELERDGVGQVRYRMHDLVAEFAAERADHETPAAEREAALDRLLDAWLGAATLADEELGFSSAVTAGLDAPEPPADAVAAAHGTPNDWFEAERAALLATLTQASPHTHTATNEHDPGRATGRVARADRVGALALRMDGFLTSRTYDDDRLTVLRTAVAAVRRSGTDGMLTRLLGALFSVYARLDQLDKLPALAAEQLEVARRLGDRTGEVRSLMQLGMLFRRQGRLAEAHRVLAEAAGRCDGLSVLVQTTVLASQAVVHLEEGNPEAALPLAAEAVRRQREDRSPRMVGMRLGTYGEVQQALGEFGEAERAFAESRELLDASGTDLAAGFLDTRLAELRLAAGDPVAAAELLDRAMSTYERHDDAGGRADVLRTRGDLAFATGHPADAVPPLRESLALFRRIGQPLDEARLLARLARARAATGDPAAAGDAARSAAILAELGLTEAALRLPRPGPNSG